MFLHPATELRLITQFSLSWAQLASRAHATSSGSEHLPSHTPLRAPLTHALERCKQDSKTRHQRCHPILLHTDQVLYLRPRIVVTVGSLLLVLPSLTLAPQTLIKMLACVLHTVAPFSMANVVRGCSIYFICQNGIFQGAIAQCVSLLSTSRGRIYNSTI